MWKSALCFVILATGFSATLHAAADRPNIVLIMADDLGYEGLSCNGSLDYKTPYLDKLAAEGVRFEHFHSQPICTPTRVKLMTGLSNKRNYIRFGRLARDQITFGHIFKEAGYKTCIAGKWQLATKSTHHNISALNSRSSGNTLADEPIKGSTHVIQTLVSNKTANRSITTLENSLRMCSVISSTTSSVGIRASRFLPITRWLSRIARSVPHRIPTTGIRSPEAQKITKGMQSISPIWSAMWIRRLRKSMEISNGLGFAKTHY